MVKLLHRVHHIIELDTKFKLRAQIFLGTVFGSGNVALEQCFLLFYITFAGIVVAVDKAAFLLNCVITIVAHPVAFSRCARKIPISLRRPKTFGAA